MSGWAFNSWAPAAVHKKINGKEKFFLYFANSASSIGVLTADSPIGPWTDPLQKPLISKSIPNCGDIVWLFDPAVFIDDDGKGYLYFGGGVPQGRDENPDTARMVQLGDDMTSLAGIPEVIKAPYLFEDSGINRIGGKYYYTYCSNWSSRDKAVGPYKPGTAEIIYMTGDTPLGPWTYQGSILKNPGAFFGTYGNNHHCLINFKDNWYIFYHSELLRADMKLSANGYRCVQVDAIDITKDGTIGPATMTRKGVKQLKNIDPFVENEAETFAWMGGITTRQHSETKVSINDINTGDWIGISQVDFGTKGAVKLNAKASSVNEGYVIKVCIDDPESEALGYLQVPVTGDPGKFIEAEVNLKKITGRHNLFFVFAGNGFEFDSWKFE